MRRRVTGILLVILGAGALLYFTWAAHRIELDALAEREWPRPFPYPDRWLVALNKHYEAKHPVTGPFVKLHGELPRVRRDLNRARQAGAIVCLAGLLVLASPAILRRVRSRRRGFDVVPGPGDASAKP